MIAPGKFVSLDESALGHIGIILTAGPKQISLSDLYKKVEKEFDGLDQFLIALDILYLLEKVEVDFSTRMLRYVD